MHDESARATVLATPLDRKTFHCLLKSVRNCALSEFICCKPRKPTSSHVLDSFCMTVGVFLDVGSKHPETTQIKMYEQYSMKNYA